MKAATQRTCSFIHVDDNPDDLYLIREIAGLTRLPFQIKQFATPERFLSYLADPDEFPPGQPSTFTAPAFLLLDYNLETMTAPEIVPKVRALPLGRSLPIIIYTSSTEPANAASAYQAGADHFLTKPGRLSRVKLILETLYVATASKAKGYSPLMALPEYLRPDLAALSASHHQPEA